MFCVLFLLFIFSNTGKIPNGNPHTYLLSSLKSVAWSINHFVMTALKRVTHPRRNRRSTSRVPWSRGMYAERYGHRDSRMLMMSMFVADLHDHHQ
jgi:hypothetical protein